MKKIFAILFAILLASQVVAQTTVSTEAGFQYNEKCKSGDFMRVKTAMPFGTFTADWQVNVNGQKKNDVVSFFSADVLKSKNVDLYFGAIKLGDHDRNDEGFGDITATYNFDKTNSITAEYGIGFSNQKHRDYVLLAAQTSFCRVVASTFSTNGYENIDEFLKYKYGYVAVFPEHFYVALGKETDRTIAFFGTRNYKKFGNFSFLQYDAVTGNCWIRAQSAFGSQINQNFFNLENYILSTNFIGGLMFHQVHFGPTSTKGEWATKIDFRKAGGLEKKEFLLARQFGSYGQVGIGFQNLLSQGNGFTAEYFNTVKIGKVSGSLEFRYESNQNLLSGFITASLSL